MSKTSRSSLYPEFRNGEKPDETDFANLIDSFYNWEDDTFHTLYLGEKVALPDPNSKNILILTDEARNVTGELRGDWANFLLGGNGQDADFILRNSLSNNVFRLDADARELEIFGSEGKRVLLKGDSATIQLDTGVLTPYVIMDGEDATIKLGTYQATSGESADLDNEIILEGQTGIARKEGGGHWLPIVSDRRYKKNIKHYKLGVEAVKKLNPMTFQYDDRIKKNDEKIRVGLIAQDLESDFPEMVVKMPKSSVRTSQKKGQTAQKVTEEHILNVDSSNVTYMLINAVKELSARVEDLEAQLAEK